MRAILAMSVFALLAAPGAAQGAQTGSEPEPLKAAIWRSASPSLRDAEFVVNRPAHVAVFEIVPGRGSGLLYPSLPSHDSRVDAGWHAVVLTPLDHRWFYLQPMLAASFGPSRYLLVVASESPLRLESVASPSGLQHALGARFGSAGALGTIGEILAIMAPEDAQAEWTYNVYVDGIAPEWSPRRYFWVQCGYRAIRVPLDLIAVTLDACRGETQVRTASAAASERRDWKACSRRYETLAVREWLRGNRKPAITARDRWAELGGGRPERAASTLWDRRAGLGPWTHLPPRGDGALDRLREWKAGESGKPVRRSP